MEQIANDERVFVPDESSARTVEERRNAHWQFQPVAEELIELGRNGYVEKVNPTSETSSGHDYIILVNVKGLTAKGRRALEEGRQNRRLVALKKIYDRVGDNSFTRLGLDEFTQAANVTEDEAHEILAYLGEKGYLGSGIGLSHRGVVEAERIITDRQEATRILGSWLREDELLVREREGRRFRILRRLYDMSGGSAERDVSYREVQTAERLDDEQWWPAYYWLEAEGLLEEAVSSRVRLTAQGVDEIERTKKAPQSSTEHFPSIVIQNNYGNIGAIQSGSHNTANVSQQLNANTELRILVQQLHAAIEAQPDSPEKNEALEQFEVLKEEAEAEQPRPNRIKSCLKAIGGFVKDVSVDLASSAIMKQLGGPG